MYTWGYIKDASLAKLDLTQEEANVMGLLNRFPFYANEVITQISSSVKPKREYWELSVSDTQVGTVLKLNDAAFISFTDDISVLNIDGIEEECHDDVLEYVGYNAVICKVAGNYRIPYNARWYTFSKTTLDNEVLPIPHDILECIPSYIAHQCFKIDDEYKASVYRNEYEMFVARIDDSRSVSTSTFKIGGDW